MTSISFCSMSSSTIINSYVFLFMLCIVLFCRSFYFLFSFVPLCRLNLSRRAAEVLEFRIWISMLLSLTYSWSLGFMSSFHEKVSRIESKITRMAWWFYFDSMIIHRCISQGELGVREKMRKFWAKLVTRGVKSIKIPIYHEEKYFLTIAKLISNI